MTLALALGRVWIGQLRGEPLLARFPGAERYRIAEAKPGFTRLFKEYGLPLRMRTDKGAPFASSALGRLSQRSRHNL